MGDPEAQQAATKIQATVHGKKERKAVQVKKEQARLEKDPEAHRAATNIQARFRGNKERKALDAEAEVEVSDSDEASDFAYTVHELDSDDEDAMRRMVQSAEEEEVRKELAGLEQ